VSAGAADGPRKKKKKNNPAEKRKEEAKRREIREGQGKKVKGVCSQCCLCNKDESVKCSELLDWVDNVA